MGWRTNRQKGTRKRFRSASPRKGGGDVISWLDDNLYSINADEIDTWNTPSVFILPNGVVKLCLESHGKYATEYMIQNSIPTPVESYSEAASWLVTIGKVVRGTGLDNDEYAFELPPEITSSQRKAMLLIASAFPKITWEQTDYPNIISSGLSKQSLRRAISRSIPSLS